MPALKQLACVTIKKLNVHFGFGRSLNQFKKNQKNPKGR